MSIDTKTKNEGQLDWEIIHNLNPEYAGSELLTSRILQLFHISLLNVMHFGFCFLFQKDHVEFIFFYRDAVGLQPLQHFVDGLVRKNVDPFYVDLLLV